MYNQQKLEKIKFNIEDEVIINNGKLAFYTKRKKRGERLTKREKGIIKAIKRANKCYWGIIHAIEKYLGK